MTDAYSGHLDSYHQINASVTARLQPLYQLERLVRKMESQFCGVNGAAFFKQAGLKDGYPCEGVLKCE